MRISDWSSDVCSSDLRDFTFNALSANPVTGAIFDYFGGLEDLRRHHVRFIGSPLARIAEDHLRILRFFRFHARFGKGAPDPAGLAACTARANDLMALSRERIAEELLKLLALPDAHETVAMMHAAGIFAPVLPEIDAHGVALLDRSIRREQLVKATPAAHRRRAALCPRDPEDRRNGVSGKS